MTDVPRAADRSRREFMKVAAIGYREIEPANGYNNRSPAEFRSMLDRLGLTMPSTHSGARRTGAELEKQLEGFQIMEIKYNAASWGDSLAAARVSYQNMARILS